MKHIKFMVASNYYFYEHFLFILVVLVVFIPSEIYVFFYVSKIFGGILFLANTQYLIAYIQHRKSGEMRYLEILKHIEENEAKK